MKKTLVFGFALAFSITPLSAFAAVNSINGLTAADQLLVSPNSGATNTMHMDIITVGTDTHRFKWDGTPWRIDQGGTGWTNFTPGTLIYGNGSSGLATTTPATSGQILQFNGTFPTWVSTSSLGIIAQATGSDREIQFNDNGVLAASPRLRWTTGLLVQQIRGSDIMVDEMTEPIAGGVGLGDGTVTNSSIQAGSVYLQGGNVQILDETTYSEGIRSGGVGMDGGTIAGVSGSASGAELSLYNASWDSGAGWVGGDAVLQAGS